MHTRMMSPPSPVSHRTIDVDGVRTFYRESGPPDAPVVLLPHGYPCSSFQFRHFLAALGDRWHLVAPDLPGFGYSATPDPAGFSYTFTGYGDFLGRFVDTLGLTRYAIYLHDYGSQHGFQLAMSAPERVAALIIQNGDIYEDELGPKYAWLKEYWANPTPEGREKMAGNVSEEGFRDEFVGELPERLVERVSPDLWTLHWSLMREPPRPEIVVGIFEDQANTLERFPRIQAYLRAHRPPTLIAWGPHDGYMPEGSARAYLRDLPDAELHMLDGGHWALETNLDEIVALARDFLGRVHADAGAPGML
jgi:pimeloyl-ACP methyl ester carboxylesterase